MHTHVKITGTKSGIVALTPEIRERHNYLIKCKKELNNVKKKTNFKTKHQIK